MTDLDAFCPQRTDLDCGVAVVAALCSVSYERAVEALSLWREGTDTLLPSERPDPTQHGNTTRELRRAVRALGVPSRCVYASSRYWTPVGEEDGALMALDRNSDRGHWLAVVDGRIWCPLEGAWWTPSDYFGHYDADPFSLVATRFR
ncbi:MAG: hypothetical protein CMM84_03665 [Rhodothermaceae bacterium]|nr:hypothetical protein [Rhodothermaceae bacterium]MBC15314.1 hypothetical protein [Rhodothermaceae bacterium]